MAAIRKLGNAKCQQEFMKLERTCAYGKNLDQPRIYEEKSASTWVRLISCIPSKTGILLKYLYVLRICNYTTLHIHVCVCVYIFNEYVRCNIVYSS